MAENFQVANPAQCSELNTEQSLTVKLGLSWDYKNASTWENPCSLSYLKIKGEKWYNLNKCQKCNIDIQSLPVVNVQNLYIYNVNFINVNL